MFKATGPSGWPPLCHRVPVITRTQGSRQIQLRGQTKTESQCVTKPIDIQSFTGEYYQSFGSSEEQILLDDITDIQFMLTNEDVPEHLASLGSFLDIELKQPTSEPKLEENAFIKPCMEASASNMKDKQKQMNQEINKRKKNYKGVGSPPKKRGRKKGYR